MGSEWKPIETAPRDGTKILVYCGVPERPSYASMTTVKWSLDGWALLQAGGWAEDYEPQSKPTYWMPLPPPPGELT